MTHTLVTTAGNVADVTQAHALMHGGEKFAYDDAGYQGVAKRADDADKEDVIWHVAMKR